MKKPTILVTGADGQLGSEIRRLSKDNNSYIGYPAPAKRPFYAVLDNSKIKANFNLAISYWTESLGKIIKELTGRNQLIVRGYHYLCNPKYGPVR